MHCLSRWFSSSLCSAALLSVACSGVAGAQLRHYVAPQRDQAAPVLNYKTPADLVLLPFLKAHSAVSPQGTTSNLQPMANTYVTAPAFAGYVNAPMIDARTSASLATGSFNNGVTVELTADFNKDGKPDIAVFQQDGTLNVLLNNGTGGLSPAVSYLNPNFLTASINIAYAVDVNGDGYPDVVAYDYNNNTTITWLNLGNGTFNAAVTTALDTTYGYPNMAYVADVNGDGKADLIFSTLNTTSRTTANVTLEVQLGTGTGAFGDPSAARVQTFAIAASGMTPSDYGIAVADINGDGKQDIALTIDERLTQTTGAFAVTTALGNGDGTFGTLGTTLPVSVGVVGAGIRGIPQYISTMLSFADVNGDGKLDLVTDVNGTLEVAPGKGDGTFQSVVTSPFSDVQGVNHSVVVDTNGDGKADVVSAGGTMAVYIGKGDGTFASPVAGSQYVTDPTGYYSLAVADFDGDGKKDIAQLGSDYKQVSLFYGNGTGGFHGAPLITANGDSNGLYSQLLTSGKYTASGYSSPVIGYSGGTAAQLVTNVNDGKGNFTSVQALAAFPADMQYIQPIHADFNGDGLEDLVYANITGDVMIALSKGDGTFATPVAAGLPAAPCPVYYGAAGDVNGDGKMDLVIPYGGDVACASGAGGPSGYYVALGRGDGTFSAATFVATGTELYSLQLGDINNDGKLDLIIDDVPFVYGSGFQVSTAIGNGDGTFGAPSTVSQNYLVSNVVVSDINNDGKADLVLSSEEVQGNDVSTGGILTITGNGDGTFNPPSQVAIGNFFYGMQVADMNNDGNADIVATLYSTDGQPKQYYGMVTLLGYGNGQFSTPVNQLESLASTLPQVGNFVSDSAPDVMTQTGYGPALFIGQGSSTIALTASAPSITFGQPETLTATITAGLSGRPAAAGTVSFYDGATLLGTSAVTDGRATYAASSLATGKHTFKAVYSGDSNYNPATSATASVTVAALTPAFTLTATSATVSVTGGAEGVITLNLAANATFSGAVTLSCSGMPTNGTCAVNPGSVTLTAGGTSTATLAIGTTGTHAELKRTAAPWEAPAAGISLAAVFGIFFGRRKRIRMLSVVGLSLLLSCSGLLMGCGDSGNDPKKSALTVTPGTYSVTVTATPPSGSSASTQTMTLSLTVN
ncbi:MAG TPA: FG-GAP-like repeat-containing protein [Acidobacteriaceae bacterium]|jgi:hypothetical protein